MGREKENRALKLPARASIYYFSASALSKGIGILTTPIFTRILSTDGYGEYTLYMSWLGFLSLSVTSLAAGNQGYALLRRHNDKKDEYISSLLGFNFMFCAVICLLLFTFSGVSGLNLDLIFILCLQLLCDCVLAISYMKAKYTYSFMRVCICSLVQSLLSPVIAFILIYGANVGYMGRIYGLLIASLIVALPSLALLFSAHPALYDIKIWRTLLSRYMPLLPSAVSNSLSLQADRFIISAVMGTAALAKYSIAHSVGALMTMATGALGSALNPWVVRKISQNEEKCVAEVSGRIFYALGMAAVLIAALSPEAMELLAPEKYLVSLPAVFPIALSTLPAFAISLSSLGLIYCGNEGRVSLSATVSTLSGIGLGFIMIPIFGYFGAGAAHLIAQTVGALIIIIFLAKSKVKAMIRKSALTASSVSSTALVLIAYLMRDNFPIRILTALLAIAVIAYQLLRLMSMLRE